MKMMIVFLTVFLLVYGGMHLYLFTRLGDLFSPGPAGSLLMGGLAVFLVVSPILVRFVERHGPEGPALLFAYAAYTWMGFVFITLSLLIVFDILRLPLSLAGFGGSRLLAVSTTTALSLVLGLGLSAWGCYEARNVGITHITIETPKLPDHLERFRIVQISDVHLGLVFREGRLSRILDLVREAGPDLLVATGDLVDGQMDHIAGMIPLLRAVEPPCGKYAVMGNHEFYAGEDHAQEFMESAGFRVLRDETVTILDGAMVIAGVDDPAGQGRSPLRSPRGFGEGEPEDGLLAGTATGSFRLLLKHQPTVSGADPSPFDLQLSGHTHRGQIAPFNLVTSLFYRYASGYHHLPGGGRLYVSRGAGTWGPAMRILSPPEVVVIDLVRTSPKDGT
ncbi:MAG: metallophosphoesterase [Syntrophales bacterium]|jgi:predicted MPP superfamily phosphohydrolase|nr:metallophosphoesterase [Syntrophales bacterium]MCK9528711.1 metallophosphoesterase [Syntrophales bacterium]MDX9922664.1 metallophosphoesterase [Syntrophales bacterium]